MRHGYNHHYRCQNKNPFLGEGMLIFANGDDTSGGAEKAGTPEEQAARAALDQGPQRESGAEIIELYPGAGPTPPLRQALDNYQILRGGMTYLDRINRYVQTVNDTGQGEDAGADIGAFPWTDTAQKLERSMSQLEQQVSGLDLKIDDDFFVTIANREKSEQRQQMVQMMLSAYEQLNERANEEAQKVHEAYVEEYIKQYDKLSQQWENAPEAYRSYAQMKQARYKECQAHLRKQTAKAIPLGEEEALIQSLQSYQHILDGETREFKVAMDAIQNPIDAAALAKQLENLKKKKQSEFQSNHGLYKSKISAIISECERIKRDIQSSKLDETEKTNRIKKINELIEKYKQNSAESDAFAAKNFSDSSPMMETDEKGEETEPMQIAAADGSMIHMPKGLEDRIRMINSGQLSPDVSNALATGIGDELKAIQGGLEVFNKDLTGNLDQTLEQLKLEGGKGGITAPEFNMNFSTQWMSPLDAWAMLTSAAESFNRSFDRTRKRKAATVGSKIFSPLEYLNRGPFQHFSVIPDDQQKDRISSDNEEVDRYQNVYKTGDDNSIINYLHASRNRFQFKACINLLAERGRINWYDPIMLEKLNGFQKLVHFDTKNMELYHANESEFHKALSVAIDATYGDKDLFRNLNAQTQSAYTSGKEKFKAELFNMSRARGGLQKLAVEMLKEYSQGGGLSNVNPQKFEYVIELGVMEGALQPAELGLYFLIQAANVGLLPFERLTYLYANKANDIPYLEIFNEGIFDRQTLKKWASIDPIPATFDTLAGYSVPHNYMRWFHTFVMHNPRVRARASKVLSGGRAMDSDLVALFLPYGSENSAINFLQIKPDGSHAEEWAINNASQYQLFTLHSQLAGMDEMDRETEGKMEDVKSEVELQNMIASFVKMDSIMDKRYLMTGSKTYVRWSDTLKNQAPRSGHFVNNYFWDGKAKKEGKALYGTAYDYALRTREIISKLDPEIFSVIFKNGIPTDSDVSKVVNLAKSKYGYDFDGKPPNTADAMYEGIAGLIGAIISKQNVAGGTLKQLIAEVKSGHNEYYAAQNEKNGTEWGGPINFYPSVDSEGQLIKQANKNWHITGSDS